LAEIIRLGLVDCEQLSEHGRLYNQSR
jgi:hypothetical protein